MALSLSEATTACYNPLCTNNKLAKLSKCAHCRMAQYCSVKCQRSHWSSHKSVCAEMASFPPELRKFEKYCDSWGRERDAVIQLVVAQALVGYDRATTLVVLMVSLCDSGFILRRSDTHDILKLRESTDPIHVYMFNQFITIRQNFQEKIIPPNESLVTAVFFREVAINDPPWYKIV